ncbi:hypothetical protein LTSERUB_6822 [Salmonella enterica subsp. enterica serovar Rubislaw str. A4-653]|uniref:Uncharacterized protein n=1 Tax=Salmonella enterica subsp. enterica serovar Rubislaw str. A4-653 TaxID=913081 RepID=G5QCV0_SALRU|nr:hypothetical protein LTSERUB_6822 [Salmonella enterica subsp. enterica serovar Rubislaw str. A4-653]
MRGMVARSVTKPAGTSITSLLFDWLLSHGGSLFFYSGQPTT